MEFSYDSFVKCLVSGDQRIFGYKDMILVVENTGKKSNFIVDRKGLRIIEQKYITPESLLENARVDGKSLKDIWEFLTMA